MKFEAAIFDIDGVLVDSPHEKAWRESLRQLMENQWAELRHATEWSPEAFTSRVYQQFTLPESRVRTARARRSSTSGCRRSSRMSRSTRSKSKRWSRSSSPRATSRPFPMRCASSLQ